MGVNARHVVVPDWSKGDMFYGHYYYRVLGTGERLFFHQEGEPMLSSLETRLSTSADDEVWLPVLEDPATRGCVYQLIGNKRQYQKVEYTDGAYIMTFTDGHRVMASSEDQMLYLALASL